MAMPGSSSSPARSGDEKNPLSSPPSEPPLPPLPPLPPPRRAARGSSHPGLSAAATLVRRALPLAREAQWGFLLCASFFGMLRRRHWYLTSGGRREVEGEVGVPPYAFAWILRLATLLLGLALGAVRRWGRGRARGCIVVLLRILVAGSLAGETYFWALTPAYLREAVALDLRSVVLSDGGDGDGGAGVGVGVGVGVGAGVPRWLALFSVLLCVVDVAAFAYSVAAAAVTALYLYVWVSGPVLGGRDSDGVDVDVDVERTIEEGWPMDDGEPEEAEMGHVCIHTAEGDVENFDLLSKAA